MRVDLEEIKGQEKELREELTSLEEEMKSVAQGREVDLRSSTSIANFLFRSLHVAPPHGCTWTNVKQLAAALSSSFLEELAKEEEGEGRGGRGREPRASQCARLILEHRRVSSLLHSHLLPLHSFVVASSVHCLQVQDACGTGRIATRSPNLQCLPKRRKERSARDAIVAREGCMLMSADFSQVRRRGEERRRRGAKKISVRVEDHCSLVEGFEACR